MAKVHLLKDDSNRREMGEQAVRIIENHFQTEYIMNQYEDLYYSLLEAGE